MKAKKAIKRLSKAETLMPSVAEGYAANADHILELLDSTRVTISKAKAAVDQSRSEQPPRKAAASATKPVREQTQATAKEKKAVVAAKGAAVTKRNGTNVAARAPVSKTA